jgi:hypothetical protein
MPLKFNKRSETSSAMVSCGADIVILPFRHPGAYKALEKSRIHKYILLISTRLPNSPARLFERLTGKCAAGDGENNPMQRMSSTDDIVRVRNTYTRCGHSYDLVCCRPYRMVSSVLNITISRTNWLGLRLFDSRCNHSPCPRFSAIADSANSASITRQTVFLQRARLPVGSSKLYNRCF